VSEIVATVGEMAKIAEETNDRAAKTVRDATQTEDVAKTGREAALNSIEAMDGVRVQVVSIASDILALAERAQLIGEITATVNDIAEQTNVLALNAAVEASRAGQHGKGFAVVAAEVKRLAQRAKDATQQVRQHLAEIQQAASKAARSTEDGTRAVTDASEIAAKTGQSIDALLETISESARSARQISASASQQAVGSAQLNETMQRIRDVAADNVEGLRQIEVSAQDLSELSSQLADLTA
jgi:methyl-accepting chemotaxis protein